MSTILNDPNSRPHPPPPPPDTNGGPIVPKGVKKAARNCVPRDISNGRVPNIGRQGVQRLDCRHALERGPGHQLPYDSHSNYPRDHQPYPGGFYPPGSHQPGGGHHPPGGPTPGYGPSKYPAAGSAPQARLNPAAPHPSSSSFGGYSQAPGVLVKNWRKFMMNQRVKVNVIGNGWLVGVVVAIIEGLKIVTNSPVRVRYIDPNEQQREDDFENHPDVIRPFPESEY